jgi:hypothetical protein
LVSLRFDWPLLGSALLILRPSPLVIVLAFFKGASAVLIPAALLFPLTPLVLILALVKSALLVILLSLTFEFALLLDVSALVVLLPLL